MVDQPIENAGPSEGTPMVKTQPSGADILSGISVDQANYLLTLSAPAAGSDQIRIFMINMGLVGCIFPIGLNGLRQWFIWGQGQNVSRTAYPELFSAYGTTFGAGDGSSTFGIPDLRGRVLAHPDSGTGRLSTILSAGGALGGVGGEQVHYLTTAELAAHAHTLGGHTHTYSDTTSGQSANHTHNYTAPTGVTNAASGSGGAAAGVTTATTANSVGHTHTTSGPTAGPSGGSDAAGSGAYHNNVQHTIAMNMMIFAGR